MGLFGLRFLVVLWFFFVGCRLHHCESARPEKMTPQTRRARERERACAPVAEATKGTFERC